MKKIIIAIIFAFHCLITHAMNQPVETVDAATSALFTYLSPYQVRKVNKSQTPRATTYHATFYNEDQLTCTQDRYLRRTALLTRQAVNKSTVASDPDWYTLLETTHQRRQDLRALAKEKLKEHRQKAEEEQILAPVEGDPHREKRKEFHRICIMEWQHRLAILDFLETAPPHQ